MSLWDRQSAYCPYGPLLLHHSLTTVGWSSRRGSQWQEASVSFSLGSFTVKDSGVTQSRTHSSTLFFSFFVALWMLFCFILCRSDTSVFLSFPWVAIFEPSDGPAVSVPSWNKLTLSPPCLVLSTWWERRQRTFLHSWVLDAALITTPETETWALSVSSCLFHSVVFLFCLLDLRLPFSMPIRWYSKLHIFPPEMESCIIQHGWHHKQS